MNDNAMSVMSHLDELKRRLFRVGIVSVIFIAAAVVNFRLIFDRFTANSRDLIEAAGGDIKRWSRLSEQFNPFYKWNRAPVCQAAAGVGSALV